MNREKKKNGDDKTSINQLLTAIFIYSSIFFAAGLTYDIVLYTLDAKWFLLAANTAALLMMGAVFAVYAAGKTETAMEHEPDYLRMSQAERERKEREAKSIQ